MSNTNKPLTNSLMLPPTAMSVPITAPQKLGTGSATGNPRNKCALKPGHSLMDWIRLGNSGVDLAGTRGRVMPVSGEELTRHNKRDDAWMAIRGKVYNVTHYMDFHPGGVEELMRGVGSDATKLFNEVHAWVNYEQLLAKCFIGPLRNVVNIDVDILQSLQIKTKKNNEEFLTPKLPAPPTEIIPRFDWIQKRNDLSFYIYTRQCCNPGVILRRSSKDDSALQLRVQIAHTTHIFEFKLEHSVDWPPQAVKIVSETGKIEVQLRKSQAELWSTYGKHTITKVMHCVDEEELNSDFELVSCKDFNHDSYDLCFNGRNVLMLLPIGFHLSIEAIINDNLVHRSYTPVPVKYLHMHTVSNSAVVPTHLYFLVKSYATAGLLSTHMRQLNVGETLKISAPKGNFELQRLLSHKQLSLLAAGSGLTPFLSLITHLLQRATNKIEKLRLMYFNKTEADIWCREELEQLQNDDDRFTFVNILSKSDATWHGLKGRITLELMAPIMQTKAAEYATFVAVCGPSAFNQHVETILAELKFKSENIHIFQG